jgi:hypothetical protein
MKQWTSAMPSGFVLTLILVVSGIAPVTAQQGDISVEQTRVKTLVPEAMPLNLDYSAVATIDGQRALTCRATNNTNQQITAVGMGLSVYKSDGNVRGGEGWITGVEIAPHASVDISIRLTTSLQPGDQVVLQLQEVRSPAGSWKADQMQLIQASKAYVKGDKYLLPKASYVGNR